MSQRRDAREQGGGAVQQDGAPALSSPFFRVVGTLEGRVCILAGEVQRTSDFGVCGCVQCFCRV